MKAGSSKTEASARIPNKRISPAGKKNHDVEVMIRKEKLDLIGFQAVMK
jgi:hypothetical protein